MTKEEARQIIATWLVSSKGIDGQRGYIEGWFDEDDAEAFRMAIEALKAPTESTNTPTDTPTGLISRQDAIDALGEEPDIWNDTEEEWAYRNAWVEHISAIKALPTRITEYKTFCGVPIEEAARIVQEHKTDPLCALADRTCPFQGKEFAWCLTCPHISEEDRNLVREAVEGSQPKTGEWVEVTNGRGGHECSECHSYAPSYASGDEHLSDYCPNCGKRMVREDGE